MLNALNELLPFTLSLNARAIACTGLWSLALYLGFFPVSEWVIVQLNRWFNFAERSLYTSDEEFERSRKGWESQNAFYASIFSIFPFLFLGWLCNYGIVASLDRSWSLSLGIIACIGCGIYEIGRRDGQASK